VKNLSQKQFMAVHEIVKLPFTDTRKGESKEATLARKLKGAKEGNWAGSEGLYDSIKEHGVKEPVDIIHHPEKGMMLGEGHHRVAAAMDINPKMKIPVRHKSFEDAFEWEL
jgi:hypothetical protein